MQDAYIFLIGNHRICGYVVLAWTHGIEPPAYIVCETQFDIFTDIMSYRPTHRLQWAVCSSTLTPTFCLRIARIDFRYIH